MHEGEKLIIIQSVVAVIKQKTCVIIHEKNPKCLFIKKCLKVEKD